MKKYLIMITISILFISNSWGNEKCENINSKKNKIRKYLIKLENQKEACSPMFTNEGESNENSVIITSSLCEVADIEKKYWLAQLTSLEEMVCIN